MIGLVNAAGTPVPSKAQSVFQAAQLAHDSETKDPVLIVNSQQAVEQVLRSAVETIKFVKSQGERQLPDGDGSDRFDQADQEALVRETGGVGRVLDVTA